MATLLSCASCRSENFCMLNTKSVVDEMPIASLFEGASTMNERIWMFSTKVIDEVCITSLMEGPQ